MKDIAEAANKKSLNQIALWELFINNCKMNLHIGLCLSPIGSKLRIRLRNFPSLVSCTSPLWILPWSDNALFDVAIHFLKQQENDELDY
jgi:dynein heavy chain